MASLLDQHEVLSHLLEKVEKEIADYTDGFCINLTEQYDKITAIYHKANLRYVVVVYDDSWTIEVVQTHRNGTVDWLASYDGNGDYVLHLFKMLT